MRLDNPAFDRVLTVGDIGPNFSARLNNGVSDVDASGANILTVDILKANSELLIKNLSVDGANQITFSFASGDLDQKGRWRLQVFSQFSTASATHTDIFTFRVGANLI